MFANPAVIRRRESNSRQHTAPRLQRDSFAVIFNTRFHMKSTPILISVPPAEYDVFVVAARLVRKVRGADAPDAITLIRFQFSHRTPDEIAKDYLDCIGDFAARRRVRPAVARKSRTAKSGTKSIGRLGLLRSLRPADVSRN